jgi:tryptophan-rich sensory protein
VILLLCFLLVAAGCGLAAYWTETTVHTWYPGLNKSSLTPPDWVFAPVWTLLYILIAMAFWEVWLKKRWSPEAFPIYALFMIQFLFNVFWSALFFYLKRPDWALVDIIALWVSLAVTIYLFYHISKISAWLLLPYFLWITFALYLNYQVVMLNQ